MKPEYIVKKSVLSAFTFKRIILFWLIIPLIKIICDIVKFKKEVIEFYDGKIISRKGVFSKSEKTTIFLGVYSVNISQSFMGRIFNYGNISVDAVGKWDINCRGVKDPKGLKVYLEKFIKQSSDNTVKIITG